MLTTNERLIRKQIQSLVGTPLHSPAVTMHRLAKQFVAENNARERSHDFMLGNAPAVQLVGCAKAEKFGWSFTTYLVDGFALYHNRKTGKNMYVYSDGSYKRT